MCVSLNSRLVGYDAYELRVETSGISIAGVSPAAVFYALQTLQALRRENEEQIACCVIHDSADFARRGLYLDCSRGKVPTLATLEVLLDRCAAWKLNELQIYVENVFTFVAHPDIGKGSSPFTPDDFSRLQEMCLRRHMRLVGSLASLGHMETVLSLPRYQSLGEYPGFRDYPAGTTLCVTDPGSLKLIDELYEEFVPLFEAEDFNLCGDEPWELGKGRSRHVAEQRGEGVLYAEYISALYHDLRGRYGKRVNMWGDMVANHPECLEHLPRDMVMLHWDYSAEGHRFDFGRVIREQGFPLVVCPGTNAWQSHGSRLATALKNVSGFARAGREQGAEGLLMTDWGDAGHRNFLGASLLSIAYAAAHAWNGEGVDDARFLRQACREVLGYADPEQAVNRLFLLSALSPSEPQALYHGLLTAIDQRHDFFEGIDPGSPVRMIRAHAEAMIDRARPEEMIHVIESIHPGEYGSVLPSPGAGFEELARCELALAARMDVLAARKILIAQGVRAKNLSSGKACRELAGDMQTTSMAFQTLWLTRNRPSRLADNMQLWNWACEELLDLSR